MSAIDQVRADIDAVEDAAQALATAVAKEAALEDARWAVKTAAIRRLMASENTLTGKMHSASSADSVVEADTEYAAYRAWQRDAVVAKMEAAGRYEAAKLRGRLAVALVEVGVSV